MHKTLAYAAFGWLTFSGTMHFVIDALSQYLRNKRAPGPETTLYYGLHSSYALGQVLLGALGLMLVAHAIELVDRWPFLALCTAAIAGWFAIGFLFIEYREPKYMLGIFTVLFLAMAATR